MNSFVVRTPYKATDLTPSFSEAKSYFSMYAKLMGVNAYWYKGKGRVSDGERYHYWLIDNEVDATAFFLAVGDHIKQNGLRKKK